MPLAQDLGFCCKALAQAACLLSAGAAEASQASAGAALPSSAWQPLLLPLFPLQPARMKKASLGMAAGRVAVLQRQRERG